MKLPRPRTLSQQGITHYIMPAVFLLVFCAMGYYAISRIHADAPTSPPVSLVGSSTGSGTFGSATPGSDDASATAGSTISGSEIVGSDDTGSSVSSVPNSAAASCAVQANAVVTGDGGVQYFINPDRYGGGTMCPKNTDGKADFTVVSGGAVQSYNGKVQAFPDIVYGCTATACTKSSGLPKEVSAFGDPKMSLRTTTIKTGKWDDVYDIWFSNGSAVGDANSAELLIMFNHRDLNIPSGAKVSTVTVDGATWDTYRSVQHSGSKHWNFIVFRKVSSTNTALNLALVPFLTKAESGSGGITSKMYLSGIDAGFEIWRGGLGLAIGIDSVGGI